MANVLLAEDDGDVAALLSFALEERGHRVRRASDGAQALAIARREDISIAIVDLLLPRESGIEVATSLRESSGIPVVLISGIYRAAADQARAVRETGAVGFLEKPFDPTDLVELVEGTLAKRRTSEPRLPGPPDDDLPTMPGAKQPAEPLADDLAREESREVERLAEREKAPKGGRFEGSFGEKTFARLLFELFEAGTTGGLLVVREPVKKVVFFDRGLPVFVKSNLLSECLGKVLVKEGLISEEQCRESLRRLQKSKRPQGEILTEMGALDAAGLERGLRRQTETKLLDLFGWPAGQYHWSAHMRAPATSKKPFDHPLALLAEGVRRKMDVARIRRDMERALDRSASIRPAGSAALAHVELSAEEKAFVASLDGRGSLRDKIAEAPDPDLALRLACTLLIADMLELGETVRKRMPVPFPDSDEPATLPPPPPSRATPVPRGSSSHPATDLDAEVERVLEAERRFQRGVTLLEEGRADAAVEALERAVSLCPDETEFRIQLAEALGKSGDTAGAIQAYERVLELDPRSTEAQSALAELRR